MALALGIDTGGTYTDGVIYDLDNQKVLAKAKALTTYNDLTIGIRECIISLDYKNFDQINLVSLSTTLATNAIVEGRGCEVGLLLIGEEPIIKLPVKHYAVIPGGHDIKGDLKEELDLGLARQALENFKGKVEAIAISGYFSVRNPEHELMVKDLVQEIMDVPVVCGHQLTTALGYNERAVTAALNARLIPIIANLIDSVKLILKELGVNAQLMVVKGDGTLMSDSLALQKPIETILSGPAASLMGANALTDTSSALVLDMGGTTTDIAVVQNGFPRLNPEGAVVGGWLTRVQAADIYTYGVGGDSHIRLDHENKLLIGPQKVWPLAVVGAKYPYLLEELREQQENSRKLHGFDAADCYMLLRSEKLENLSEPEKNIIELLKRGPRSLLSLSKAMNKSPFSLSVPRLVSLGLLARVAVTPTDILHVKGIYQHWNGEIAQLGVEILAKKRNESLESFIEYAMDEIVNQLSLTILASVLKIEGAPTEITDNVQLNYFINKFLAPQTKELLSSQAKVNLPIIGIGAPVEAYLPQVSKKLNTELIIPLDSEVANAIGAATGKVMEKVEVLIHQINEGYSLHSQWERKVFTELKDAKEYGLQLAKRQAMIAAEAAGTVEYQMVENCQDIYFEGRENVLMESRIEITIIGRPKWG